MEHSTAGLSTAFAVPQTEESAGTVMQACQRKPQAVHPPAVLLRKWITVSLSQVSFKITQVVGGRLSAAIMPFEILPMLGVAWTVHLHAIPKDGHGVLQNGLGLTCGCKRQ